MSEQGQFDLCPKCGGIARDGVCQSCGYVILDIQDAIEQDKMEQTELQQTIAQEQPEQSVVQEQPADGEENRQTQEEQAVLEQDRETPPRQLPNEDALYATPDVYQAQSGQDVYCTPDIGTGHHATGGMFSGEQAHEGYGEPVSYQPEIQNPEGQNVDGNVQSHNGQPELNPYNQNQYAQGQYYQGQYSQNQYGQGQYSQGQYSQSQYGQGQYNQGQYSQSQYGQGQYNQGQYSQNQYGQGQYNQGQYSQNQYGQGQYNQGQYGQNPYGQAQYNQGQYQQNQYANNPYSPYATPPAKKHTGLIIGIIITVAILFLVALFALFYHAVEVLSEKKDYSGVDTDNMEEFYREYFDDDWYEEHQGNQEGYSYDDYDEYDYDDYDYDDYYYDDYNYDDDEYYTLHDDLKDGLSYSIEWGDYEYEPDDTDVIILVEYPIVVGDDIPNLDKINELFADEVSVFQEYYEEEYSNYMTDEDSYFYVSSMGYVTYMDEDVLSVVFHENIYSDYYDSAFLYSINIDMKDGVVLDNTDIIAVNDDFSIDFRYRSDEQNGTIDALDMMSDQEITAFLTDESNLIIFYTPQGMEIGFNYDEGWVTATYHDYEEYLKIF